MFGVKPIVQKFLERNYLFALEFAEGFVFGRVVRKRHCHYKPYPLIDENGNAVDISPNSHAGPYVLRDPRNPANKLLYLPTPTSHGYAWIMHGSIGVKPEQIRVYVRYPSGQDVYGRFPNIDPIRPTNGDAVGYVSSQESPYEEPTDWLEIVLIPSIDISFEFYNTDDARSHQPVLNILFATYWFEVLKPENPVHARLISKIAAREVPAAFFQIGFGDTPINFNEVLKKEWGVTPLKLDEALKLGR